MASELSSLSPSLLETIAEFLDLSDFQSFYNSNKNTIRKAIRSKCCLTLSNRLSKLVEQHVRLATEATEIREELVEFSQQVEDIFMNLVMTDAPIADPDEYAFGEAERVRLQDLRNSHQAAYVSASDENRRIVRSRRTTQNNPLNLVMRTPITLDEIEGDDPSWSHPPEQGMEEDELNCALHWVNYFLRRTLQNLREHEIVENKRCRLAEICFRILCLHRELEAPTEL